MQIKAMADILPRLNGLTLTPVSQAVRPDTTSLQAVVARLSADGLATLRVGEGNIEVKTPLPLLVGQKLTVNLLKEGDGHRLIVSPQELRRGLISHALRNALPRQTPLGPVLATISQAARGAPGQATPPPQVADAIRQIYNQLPTPRTLSDASGLRTALRDSGMFMEAGLARAAAGKTSPGSDMKTHFLRLLAQLRASGATPTAGAGAQTRVDPTQALQGRLPGAATPVPATGQAAGQTSAPATPAPIASAAHQAGSQIQSASFSPNQPLRAEPGARPTLPLPLDAAQVLAQLSDQAEGGLARLQVNQLLSLPSDDSGKQCLQMQLPVRDGERIDTWEIRLEEEADKAAKNRKHGKRWNVDLAFDLPGIGPGYVRIRIGGDKVGVDFWMEHPHGAERLREHVELLRSRLAVNGLGINHLRCNAGTPPPTPPRSGPDPILDLEV